MKTTADIYLKDPDGLELEDTYRSLPVAGSIAVECGITSLSGVLDAMESVGFAGMLIRLTGKGEDRVRITACKGETGPCYQTGRSAIYLGGALAVLDDDHHLLLRGKEVPVCEKTAGVYSLPCYRRFLRVSAGNDTLLKKLESDPEPFDCDTFEESLKELDHLIHETAGTDSDTELFYPGPFRVLVLDDGTMLHRGRVSRVPGTLAGKISASDGLFELKRMQAGEYESFQERYRSLGSLCFAGKAGESGFTEPVRPPDLNSLKELSGEIRTRLISLLKKNGDYFMLTGSNRKDRFGCCPSDAVTQADSLVSAGILSSYREQASKDSCPVTIYAFRNEMHMEMDNLQFRKDPAFRQEVLSGLKNRKRDYAKKGITWVLLLFIAFSTGMALNRLVGSPGSGDPGGLYEKLEMSRPDGTAVILFHYNRRCKQCLALEKYSVEVLKEDFSAPAAMKQIQFRQVIMDLPENRKLVEELGLVTSTVVLFSFRDMEMDSAVVLNRSWELYDREQEFKQMLAAELSRMVNKNQ